MNLEEAPLASGICQDWTDFFSHRTGAEKEPHRRAANTRCRGINFILRPVLETNSGQHHHKCALSDCGVRHLSHSLSYCWQLTINLAMPKSHWLYEARSAGTVCMGCMDKQLNVEWQVETFQQLTSWAECKDKKEVLSLLLITKFLWNDINLIYVCVCIWTLRLISKKIKWNQKEPTTHIPGDL